MNYFIDHNKPAHASTITWLVNEPKIEILNPFIESIICDNGNDYVGLCAKDFDELSIKGFEAIKSSDNDTFMLCYEAVISINLDNYVEFKNALRFSENMVFVHIGFKDSSGNELEDISERNIDIPVELKQI